MKLQRLLLFCLLFSSLIGRDSINYLVRVTNRTNKPFKIYCVNHYYRPIIQGTSNEFTMSGADVPETPQTAWEAKVRELNNLLYGWGQRNNWDSRASGLYSQKTILETEILNEVRPDYLQLKRKQVAELQRQINQHIEQLRLEVAPKSVVDLSCRIFSPADKPKNHANTTTDFAKSKDRTWEPNPTYLKSGDYTINVIDNDQRGKCPEGYLLLEAHDNKGHKYASCIQNSVDASKVQLIIDDKGPLLKEVRYGIVEPDEQGLRYQLPGENYHSVQGDYSDEPEKREKLAPQVSGFTKAE